MSILSFELDNQGNRASLDNKSLPSNVDVERCILGAILLNNSLCNQAIELLRRDEFYLDSHRRIFDKMVLLAERGSPIDLVTLNDELRRAEEFEQVGGATFIASLIDGVPRTDTIDYYAKIVKMKALERRLVRLAYDLQEVTAHFDDTDGLPLKLLREYEDTYQELSSLKHSKGQALDDRDRIIAADELMAMEFPEPRYAVYGILQEGANVLAGRPKTGKSRLALAVALAISCGGKALGQIDVDQGKVLYLGLEDGLRRLKRRLAPLLNGAKVPRDLHFKTRWRKLDEGGIPDLRTWMRRHPQTRLIVIDTLKKVRPAERKGARIYDLDYEAVAMVAEFAEQFGVCVLIITHTNKRENASLEDPFDAISGSTGLTGASDAMLVLKRDRGKQDAVLHITGRDIEERELALKADPVIGSWIVIGDAEEFRISEQRGVILSVLLEQFEPLAPKEVFDRLQKKNYQMSYDSVRQLMRRMALDSQIKSDGVGKYTSGHHSHHSVTAITAITVSQPSQPDCDGCENEAVTDISDFNHNDLGAHCDTVMAVTGQGEQNQEQLLQKSLDREVKRIK